MPLSAFHAASIVLSPMKPYPMLSRAPMEGLRRRGTAQEQGGSEVVWAGAGRKACERWGRR